MAFKQRNSGLNVAKPLFYIFVIKFGKYLTPRKTSLKI
ncbi:multidrug efflux RND transporter permease subunit [Acetobacter orientalis]|uniref:Multidrug efflux RND transporter permease subunit n=1 Tax=Acetobacter orientalis TaxID=146474 RepID=A0A2Z5ZCY7_9PROT|nr:multidrug efflux RND transporter permease subunit [Acetobacter orientalis]